MSQWVRTAFSLLLTGRLTVDQQGFLAGLGNPYRGNLRLGGEGHEDLLAVRATVLDPLARSRLDTGFGLHALCAKAHTPQAAIAHLFSLMIGSQGRALRKPGAARTSPDYFVRCVPPLQKAAEFISRYNAPRSVIVPAG